MKQPNQSAIIICGIVRNAARSLKRNIPVICQFCRQFKSYNVIIYENDSVDGTKELLKEWMNKDPEHVYISLENYGRSSTIPSSEETGHFNPYYSRKRISKMMELRNQYLDYIENHNLVADYLLVVDLDVARIDMDSLLSSFVEDKCWDAVCAFGYSTSPRLKRRYHDSYAFCELGAEDIPQTESMLKMISEKYAKMSPNEPWVRIASGFGGIAIFRYEAVRGLRYEVIDNDDPRIEVRCEHYSIFRQMSMAGNDKFYLNPGMKIKYQRVTPAVVLKYLRSKIDSFRK